jgi:hypothetical protein
LVACHRDRKKGEWSVRRLILAIVSSAILMVAMAGAAVAGAPGTNFPEQPGSNIANACGTVLSNPGTGAGGAAGAHESLTAAGITGGLVVDACFGG